MLRGVVALCVLLLDAAVHGFGILPGNSLSHLEITEKALLNATLQACRALAQEEGTNFSPPPQPFTPESVAAACNAQRSSKSFRSALLSIILRNVRVDLRHPLNASFHFDDEMLNEGRNIITERIMAVKASNQQENFETARLKLGELLHPLQDFYSHTNWVELQNTGPNPNLIRPDVSIGNIADIDRPTCRSCDGDSCTDNILEDIITDNILTSGYFGIFPFSVKPPGKCSHGGAVDVTSNLEPTGGINKDTFDSSHGHLHTQAANMAIAATSELLEDVREAAGSRGFLQMMGISKGSSKALCFVIDTTSSMAEDIAAVQGVTTSIIDSEVGGENEPSVFILVPFNDPVVGPLIRTSNPSDFKRVIDSLQASGGGDDAELSLTGLQLALSSAPFNSEIFLFTDAPAKDQQLMSTVTALIERTQTVVTFFITDSPAVNRNKRRNVLPRHFSRLSPSEVEVYRDLSRASGGQTVELSKTELPTAASIITESASPSLVTLLQASRSPGRTETFSFLVDQTVTKVRVYITGGSALTFTLTGPTGETQQSSETMGPLIESSQTAGNFRSLLLNKVEGRWTVKMMSNEPYTLKVIGQSPIDFLFDFVEASQDVFAGFDPLETRPRAGVNGTLLVTLTGSSSARVTEVSLVGLAGSEEIRGNVTLQEGGSFLARMERIPAEEFMVRVRGEDDDFPSSTSRVTFQRQSPTSFRSSNVTITADSDAILDPATTFAVPFSVMSAGASGNFTVRATNSRRYASTFPASLPMDGGRANGTVTLSAPRNTPSGTDVTLTIEAEAAGGDSNYIVLRISVVNSVTDFTAPRCQQVGLQENCSGSCGLSRWEVTLRVTDGDDGTGVERVTLTEGNGTISTSFEAGNRNVTLATYNASCCSPEMTLLFVDRVGNTGTCTFSILDGLQGAQSHSSMATPSLSLCAVTLGLLMLTELGLK